MESCTFEIVAAEGDPTDRSLGVLVRSDRQLVVARSFRIPPEWPLGTILLWIDRIALLWGVPTLHGEADVHDLLDTLERECGPFGY